MHHVRTPALLFLVALGARVIAGLVFPDPAYPDSYYYVNVARELAAGNGFQVDYIWNFVEVGGRLPAEPALPIASNAHWMPLAALIQVPFIWVFGASALAQGLPFWLIGALASPLAYLIGRDAGLTRGQSIAGGLLTALPGAAAPFLAQPDNFALFMPLGALALWCCGRGLKGDRRAFAVGGLVVGLATLSRTDGVLLGVPFALAFGLERWRVWRGGRIGGQSNVPERSTMIGWLPALACVAGFALIVLPWFARQLAVFGSLSPSAANGRILLIPTYRELYSITSDTTLGAFLGQGPEALLASRAGGLIAALGLFASVPLLYYLVPVTAIGAWLRRRDPIFLPWLLYGASLLLFSGLLFAVHVPYGTFMHSAVALVPHAYLLAVLGIGGAVTAIARRRSSWDVARATRNLTGAAVVFALIGGAGAVWRTSTSWRSYQSAREPLAAELRHTPRSDLVMSSDPGAYRYLAGRGGIVTPDDPLPVVEQALRAYDVRWLALESDHLVPSLAPLLRGTERPAWLSRPLVVVPARVQPGSAAAGSQLTPPAPAAALFAVCFSPGDSRCDP